MQKDKRDACEEMKLCGGPAKPGGVTFALAALLVPLEASFALADAVDVCLVADGVLAAWIGFLSTYISAGHCENKQEPESFCILETCCVFLLMCRNQEGASVFHRGHSTARAHTLP